MKEDSLELIEIAGGLTRACIDYSPSTNELLIQNGGVIAQWALSLDEKQILRTYRAISCLKLFKSGQYFVIAYALPDGIELALHSASNLQFIKQKKLLIESPLKDNQLVIKGIFLSFISKQNLLVIVKGSNKRNWLIEVRFEKLTYDLIEEFIGEFKGKVKNAAGVFYSKDSKAFITVSKEKVYYWIYNIDTREIAIVNKVKPKLNLDPHSMTMCSASNLIGLLSERGECVIYDMSASCRGLIQREATHFSHLSLEDGIVVLGAQDGKVYVYDQLKLAVKYIIETNHSSSIGESIHKVILNEDKDKLVIIRVNGSFEYYSLGSLLKNKQSASPLIMSTHHTQSIEALEWVNEPPLTFYTSSCDGQLIKWHYRGDKWTSQSIPLLIDRHFTSLKVHPQFNNFLIASDNQGSVTQIDLCSSSKEDSVKTFKVANFPIEYISFNKGNYMAVGFMTGMIMLFALNFNSKCEFCLLLNEDFIEEAIAKQKKRLNHLTAFAYFLSNDCNMLIYRSGLNKMALASINRINNAMVPSIEEELEYASDNCIVDIAVHPSERFLFVLLQSNQIDIREIISWKNVGVIDLSGRVEDCQGMSVDYTGTFLSVLASCQKGTMRSSNVMIYEIASGDIVAETGELFVISKQMISNDGRFIIVTGMDGSMAIIKLSKVIKEKMYCVFDLINSNERYWRTYAIDYPIQRRVLRKKQEKPIEKAKSKVLTAKKQKPSVIKEEEKDNKSQPIDEKQKPSTHRNAQSLSLKQEDSKKKSNLNRIPTVSLMNISRDSNIANTLMKSNYFNLQTNQKCNTMDSFNDHRLLQNSSWNKQKQYSHLGYSNSDMIALNKDPNIFSSSQPGIIQKVNKSYLHSQVLAYPQLTQNLIESSSKSQQDEIRYRNITNAIQDILTREEAVGDKSQSVQLKQNQSEGNVKAVTTSHKTSKVNKAGNEDYYINNTANSSKTRPVDQHLPEPEGIDDLSVIVKTKESRKDSSVLMNKSDISFISTSKNAQMSVADDIDYVNDNIERFEHFYKKIQ